MSTVAAFDLFILQWLNQLAGKYPLFDHLVIDVAGSTILEGGLFMAYFWWLWFSERDDKLEQRRHVVISLIGAVAAVILARVLQLTLPWHDRPLHIASMGFVLPAGVQPDTLSHWNSFPSDHAVLFFALSIAVGRQSNILGLIALLWTSIVICLPRVYLGYHFPSDIVGGALIGAPLMSLIQRLLGNSTIIDRIVSWEDKFRPLFYGIAFTTMYELAVLFFDIRYLAADTYRILRWALGIQI